MSNEPFSSFYFRLSILGKPSETDAAFQEASGFSAEMTTEDVTCGGENRFVYKLPKVTKYTNLVLKRGIFATASSLRKWCSNTLTQGLGKPIEPKDIELVLLNKEGNPCMTWVFHKAYPVKWQGSELNSEKNQLMIETMELSYQFFELKMTA